MFRAVIAPRDSSTEPVIEVSGEVTPYNLQVLREHLLQLSRRRGGVHVALRTKREKERGIQVELRDLERRGVNLVFEFE
jgi:hypothetical protein